VGDPTLQAWQVAWSGHALLTDPANLWHANAFYPERYSLAFSDSLLGYAPFGFIGSGPEAATLRYNILFVLAHVLAFVGAYALARQLGAASLASGVAGLAFAYAPWRLAHAGHLNVLSTGGIALALAMLAHRPRLVVPARLPAQMDPSTVGTRGLVVAAWQMTLGFAIGLPFGYVLALICVGTLVAYSLNWFRAPDPAVFPGRLLAADLAGGALFVGVTVLMALPYLRVLQANPGARRGLGEVGQYSPPLRGFFTAPAESWLWGDGHAGARSELSWPAEMTLLPGVVLVCVAVGGLIFSVWRVRTRVLLALGAALSVVLGHGHDVRRRRRSGLRDALPRAARLGRDAHQRAPGGVDHTVAGPSRGRGAHRDHRARPRSEGLAGRRAVARRAGAGAGRGGGEPEHHAPPARLSPAGGHAGRGRPRCSCCRPRASSRTTCCSGRRTGSPRWSTGSAA
jgi:hypothetical protein